jgi:hypothetical protein
MRGLPVSRASLSNLFGDLGADHLAIVGNRVMAQAQSVRNVIIC